MSEQEHKVDRKGWPSGPWDDEPDKLSWTTEAGLPGLIVRNGSGALCGYVGVTAEHPAYRKDCDSVGRDINVHGGLTYANKCGGAICHVPEPGKSDDVWWFGFDCAHSGDLVPAFERRGYGSYGALYCAVPYVRREVESLARQMISFGKPTDIDSADDT